MRCSSREEPWGSHHEEARALKCDTSVGSTVEVGEVGLWCRVGVVVKARVAVDGMHDVLAIVDLWTCEVWRTQRCIERTALAEVVGLIFVVSIVVFD